MATCRLCAAPLDRLVVDLGMSPLCESYRTAAELNRMEPFYPLRAHVCDRCRLVQVEEYVSPAEIFAEYAYFSSYAESWLAHARAYVDMIVPRLGLGSESLVVELGSNDGYLLQWVVARGIPVLGIEPARNIAAAALARGVATRVAFFGRREASTLVRENRRADLIIGNNVLAQVSDLNDFVAGIAELLQPDGVVTLEFPHLARLLAEVQFDTIYHEHFSYFSFATAERALAAHGLRVFDVEELPTHGGSLRVYACRADVTRWPTDARVACLRAAETEAGLERPETYAAFAEQVERVRHDLIAFLIECRRAGKRVVGYGAPGKGNTLLNYCGIRADLLAYTVDRNPYKQGKFLPGTHIPIYAPERIAETRPDHVLILPWNLRDEIVRQMGGVLRDWGGSFVVAIPRLEVLGVIFGPTAVDGAWILDPERVSDERGFFARIWSDAELAARGLETGVVQCSVSFNERAGTLRGLHYQLPPHAETKLVRCTRGAMWDVIVDLRPSSPTFLAHAAIELSMENRRILYVPEGVAHGYQTLAAATEVAYQMSAAYAPTHARGVRWDDPAFGIAWPPCATRIMNERDRTYPDFVVERGS